jgi:hypothetical protein
VFGVIPNVSCQHCQVPLILKSEADSCNFVGNTLSCFPNSTGPTKKRPCILRQSRTVTSQQAMFMSHFILHVPNSVK